MPRSAGVGDQPGRTVRCLAHGRRRLRILLRLHRRRGEPVVPDALRGHHAGRAEEDARRGLPLHGGHDRQGDGLGVAAEGAGARQAVLRLLRPRRDPCAAPCAQGVGRQVQGQVRPGLGQIARRDHRPAEEAGRHSGGLPAHRPPPGDPGVGRHAGGAKARPAPPDGGLCGLHGVHRPPCRPPARRAAEAQHPRRHAGLLHHRRQRRVGRGHVERRLQRDGQLQRAGGPRDPGIPDGAVRQARRAGIVQPLRRGLGACDEYPVPVDQAGRLPLGRHAQRHHRALAERHQGKGRDPLAVPPRHRRRADNPRGGGAPRADRR